mgnify:CR=1 FL=1
MKDKLLLIWKHLKPENLQKMWLQSKWIWQYGKRYWKSMVVYTLLGIAGSGVSLVSSFISKDLIDIITGHQTGKLLHFCRNDRFFHCKYFIFTGIHLRFDIHQPESRFRDQK